MASVNPIRVLNLFTIMDRGGSETMVMNYYRSIDRNKVQFDFLVHRKDEGMYDKEIQALGGIIYRMDPIRPWTLGTYRDQLQSFFELHSEYRIVHSHMSERGAYALKAAELAGIPIRICHAHGRPRGFELRTIPAWYLKQITRSHITDMFMCGRDAGKWLFGRRNIDKCIQFNNAIDTPKYTFKEQVRQKLRTEFEIEDTTFVLGHVGRFDAVKNHEFLLKVFEQLIKKEKDSKLLLVGDDMGSGGKHIHHIVESMKLTEHVIFSGTRNDVPNLLMAMDAFAFPSIFEGFGIAALEAQTSGLPTFVSERIPQECLITDLIKKIDLSRSPSEWASEIIQAKMIKRSDRVEKVSMAGFDIKRNAEWLEEYYLKAYNRI